MGDLATNKIFNGGKAKHYFSFQAQSNAGCQLMPQLSRTIQRWSQYFQQSQNVSMQMQCSQSQGLLCFEDACYKLPNK